jgi:hypothetical protein
LPGHAKSALGSPCGPAKRRSDEATIDYPDQMVEHVI